MAGIEDFHSRCREAWIEAIGWVAGRNPASSTTWLGITDMAKVLGPFMGKNRNHAHLPTGGGHDIVRATASPEDGCLDLWTGERSAFVLTPSALTLEFIQADPSESFLRRELGRLRPSGVYGDVEERGREKILDVGGHYLDYEVWDRGYLRHDDDGRELPIPRDARTLCRLFRGTIMFVAKGSYWNSMPETYGGEHGLSVGQIRGAIERFVAGESRAA